MGQKLLMLLVFSALAMLGQDYGSGIPMVNLQPSGEAPGTDYTADVNCLGAWFIDSTNADDIQDQCGANDLGATESQGTPTVSTTVPANSPAGYRSIDLDAAGDYYTRADDAEFDADPFTACVWGQQGNTNSTRTWFTNLATPGEPGWEIRIVSDEVRGVVQGSFEQSTGDILTDSTWEHLCFTYNDASGDNITIYNNGVEVCAFGCTSQTGLDTNGVGLGWGAETDGGKPCGDTGSCFIHEAAYFDRELAANEICEICRRGLRGDVTDRTTTCGSCTLP